MKSIIKSIIILVSLISLISCNEDISTNISPDTNPVTDPTIINTMTAVETHFGSQLDINNLFDYQNQAVPQYITKDNTRDNDIYDETATLGRVLFYDKNLSSDNSISCASCHKQAFAFGDSEVVSQGVNGVTGRHSMRLINARFSDERRFFWDERASSLEEQTTMPIQDHAEMGFSGMNGDPDLDDLIDKLSSIPYYTELFSFAYGDELITEDRIQDALAQFIRSIQSFDSKYDVGRSLVNNINQDFPNFSQQENLGKRLFSQAPQFQGQGNIRVGGGFGCQGCHRAPEFDIDPNSRNNGVIGTANDLTAIDTDVTRSPSLRDIFNPAGTPNGPFMHNGQLSGIDMVIDHYNNINRNGNNNLDPRLSRGGGQRLNITTEERVALISFLKTLSGQDVYTNEKWSNPFDD